MKTAEFLEKTCMGKKCYSKRDVVTMKNFREKEGSRPLRYYHCSYCEWFHLAHLRGKNNK
jgi:aspartate carbamoyltransferase regulatory subunit